MIIGTLEPVSNRQTWKQEFSVVDVDTDEAFDISSATAINLQVEDARTRSPMLVASLANGKITLPGDTGVFRVTFTASEMHVLDARTYNIGITVTADSETSQVFIGQLPVIDGIVD